VDDFSEAIRTAAMIIFRPKRIYSTICSPMIMKNKNPAARDPKIEPMVFTA